MENSKRNLKITSILVLVLAAFTLIRTIVDVAITKLDVSNVDGATEGVVLAAKITMCVFSLIILLPDVYIGLKGLKVAKNPAPAKAAIIWAIVLAALAAIGLIFPIVEMIKYGNVASNSLEIGDLACNIAVYCAYIVCAKEVTNAA